MSARAVSPGAEKGNCLCGFLWLSIPEQICVRRPLSNAMYA